MQLFQAEPYGKKGRRILLVSDRKEDAKMTRPIRTNKLEPKRKLWQAAFIMITAFKLAMFPVAVGQAGEKENWDAVVKSAKKEGKVVVYGGGNFRPIIDAAKPIFLKRYGIKIEYLTGRSRETRERIKTEVRTGKHIADVANAGGTSLPALSEDGGLENWVPPSLNTVRPDVRESLGVPALPITPVFVNVRGILVNTKLVPPSDMPKSWMDLVDSKWRGKMLMDDPRSAGAGNSWFVSTVLHPTLGKMFHQKLAENKPIVVGVGHYQQIASRIAHGEDSVGFPADAYWIEELKGAPVKWIAPEEGITYTINGVGLVKGAARPNAAKVFIDFTTSEDFQKIVGRTTAPVRAGVPSTRKEWSLDHVKLLPRPTPASGKEREEFNRLAESLYGIR